MVVNPLQSALVGLAIHESRAATAAQNIASFTTGDFSPADTADLSSQARTDAQIDPAPSAPPPIPPAGIDPAREMVQMKIARAGYSASAAVLLTQDETLGSVLDIIA